MSSQKDPLDSVLGHLALRASLLHSGPLCGENAAVLFEGSGHLHYIKGGCADVRHEQLPPLYIDEPTLLFYPRPLAHRFITETGTGADFLCATVSMEAAGMNPIGRVLPPVLVVPLSAAPELECIAELMVAEASSGRRGFRETVNRLFEVLVVLMLRRELEIGQASTGTLEGFAHPRLSKALEAFHHDPARAWGLDELAQRAGMSRTSFAQLFRATLGTTVGKYLSEWRVTLAQDLLRRGVPLKLAAGNVGYGSAMALTRVFRDRTGLTPRAWLSGQKQALVAASAVPTH